MLRICVRRFRRHLSVVKSNTIRKLPLPTTSVLRVGKPVQQREPSSLRSIRPLDAEDMAGNGVRHRERVSLYPLCLGIACFAIKLRFPISSVQSQSQRHFALHTNLRRGLRCLTMSVSREKKWRVYSQNLLTMTSSTRFLSWALA